jgi:hypothetical protein
VDSFAQSGVWPLPAALIRELVDEPHGVVAARRPAVTQILGPLIEHGGEAKSQSREGIRRLAQALAEYATRTGGHLADEASHTDLDSDGEAASREIG